MSQTARGMRLCLKGRAASSGEAVLLALVCLRGRARGERAAQAARLTQLPVGPDLYAAGTARSTMRYARWRPRGACAS